MIYTCGINKYDKSIVTALFNYSRLSHMKQNVIIC